MFTAQNINIETLENFYESFEAEKTFLQSAAFARYREDCGETIIIEGYFKNDRLIAVALIQSLHTRIKHWLHVPHGPLVNPEFQAKFWPWWLRHYADLGTALKKDLVRVSPLVNVETKINFTTANFKPAATHLVNPEKTWMLNLSPSKDELIAAMKKSTRYEVRKGLKPETGLKITIDHNLDAFWQLHTATAARQKFVPFTRKSTEAELKSFGDNCKIITVWHDEKPLASGIFLFDNQAGYYHQGASVYSKLPAAHAYIWAAICEAKNRGCTEFNFWGVCAEDQTQHPWFGLSRFKRGFGGQEKNYHHVHDFEITWRAKLNRIIETRRRKQRGY